ncbi:tetratricopeptide repeat protein [Pseudoroseomonas wenyumeiae]
MLQAWLANAPDDTDALMLLSQLDMQAGRMDAAEQRLSRLVTLKPRDAVALNNLAWLTSRHEDRTAAAKAEALAQRAYYLSPNQETADTLGWILARNGQAPRAVPLLRRAAAMRGNTQNPAAAYRLAYALNATGAKEEALAVLTPALATEQTFPERAEASRLLASCAAAEATVRCVTSPSWRPWRACCLWRSCAPSPACCCGAGSPS